MPANTLVLSLMFIFLYHHHYAQKGVRFYPMFKNDPVSIPFHSDTDSLTLTKCQWYVSQIRVFDTKISEWVEINPCQLMNAEDTASLRVVFGEHLTVSKLSFILGTDSLTNVSGQFEGPLDPIHGMYWAWNSGYINVKLEGTQSRIATRGHRFEYHIGGYLSHQKTAQYVELEIPTNPEKESIEVGLQINKLLLPVDSDTPPAIMLPGPEAVSFAAKLPSIFFIIVP